jgi:hypothetical protein
VPTEHSPWVRARTIPWPWGHNPGPGIVIARQFIMSHSKPFFLASAMLGISATATLFQFSSTSVPRLELPCSSGSV